AVDLANRRRIVNRVADLSAGGIEEVEVSVQHVRARHIPYEGFRCFLVVAGVAEQPERLVLAVVKLRDAYGAAQHSGEFMVRLGRLLESIKIVPVQQRTV